MAFFSVHWCRRACPRNSRQFWATRGSQESGKISFSGNSLRDLRHPSLWTFSIYRHGEAAVSPDFAEPSRRFPVFRITVATRDAELTQRRCPTRDHPCRFISCPAHAIFCEKARGVKKMVLVAAAQPQNPVLSVVSGENEPNFRRPDPLSLSLQPPFSPNPQIRCDTPQCRPPTPRWQSGQFRKS